MSLRRQPLSRHQRARPSVRNPRELLPNDRWNGDRCYGRPVPPSLTESDGLRLAVAATL